MVTHIIHHNYTLQFVLQNFIRPTSIHSGHTSLVKAYITSTWPAYTAPQTQLDWRGPTSKGREGKEEGRKANVRKEVGQERAAMGLGLPWEGRAGIAHLGVNITGYSMDTIHFPWQFRGFSVLISRETHTVFPWQFRVIPCYAISRKLTPRNFLTFRRNNFPRDRSHLRHGIHHVIPCTFPLAFAGWEIYKSLHCLHAIRRKLSKQFVML